MPGLTRRDVLVAALAAMPLAGCGSGARDWEAGSIDGIPAGTWVERKITVVPDAGEIGRELVYVRREGDGAVRALSSSCTCTPDAAGCPVRWLEAARRFVCPCHGTVYDEGGDVLGGPAKRPLAERSASVDGGTIYVGS
jgi:Rieske Fe-S protein